MAGDKDNTALTKIEEGPSLDRQKYYEYMRGRLDEYTGMVFSPEDKNKIDRHLRNLSTGASAMIPLFCAGDMCPFSNRCPYVAIGKAPLNKPCLVEIQLLQHWTIAFMEEYQVDPNSFTEVSYCNELAEIEVMLYRMNMMLSRPENATGTIDQVVGVSNSGESIVQKQISPFIEQKDKLLNRRTKIVKLMVGDRQEKYKKEAALKVREQKDPSQKMADVRRQIEGLQRNLKLIDESIKPTEEIKKLQSVLTPDDLLSSIDATNK
jgi:hypothetical protein